MTESYVVAVKQTVYQKTDFSVDDFEDGILEFDTKADAEAWVKRHNEGRYGTKFVLHTAHPNDASDADEYLYVKDIPVWTVDE